MNIPNLFYTIVHESGLVQLTRNDAWSEAERYTVTTEITVVRMIDGFCNEAHKVPLVGHGHMRVHQK